MTIPSTKGHRVHTVTPVGPLHKHGKATPDALATSALWDAGLSAKSIEVLA